MVASPMVTGKVGEVGVFLEWKRRRSVLLSLSLRPLSGIQQQMSEMHAQVSIRLAVGIWGIRGCHRRATGGIICIEVIHSVMRVDDINNRQGEYREEDGA